jgi:hypothetical protein
MVGSNAAGADDSRFRMTQEFVYQISTEGRHGGTIGSRRDDERPTAYERIAQGREKARENCNEPKSPSGEVPEQRLLSDLAGE